MEVRRGRYLVSYEHPQALVASKPIEWVLPLRDHDHVFLKGHRIMVQVQSTWFPVIDRNPQTIHAEHLSGDGCRFYQGHAADLQLGADAIASCVTLNAVVTEVFPFWQGLNG